MFYCYEHSIASLQSSTGKLTMMKFEDGSYYIECKNRVDEMWAYMNKEVVLNDMNFNVTVSGITCEVRWYIVLAVFLNCCRH